MKKFNLLMILSVGILTFLMFSCENQKEEFPDFEFTGVYFAYQSPVRTLVLGEDIFDNTLDNEHKCAIYATMGGVYSNTKNIGIDIVVDNSLCNNMFFDKAYTTPVIPMPSNYYTLAANKIFLDNSLQGAVGVQLTDAFFADSNALINNYVIPLRMTNVENADSILSGSPKVSNPVRGYAADWEIQPMDYVLYCVKYINPWHANYLRRGKDIITKDGVDTTIIRHKQFVEEDEVRKLSACSLNDLQYPMDYKNKFGLDLNFKVKLSIDASQKVTASPFAPSYEVNDSVTVYNIIVTGNGDFVKKGEKNSWGNKDRDAMYVKYDVGYEVEVQFPNTKPQPPPDIQQVSYNTVDTLVVRDRGVQVEVFTPAYKVN